MVPTLQIASADSAANAFAGDLDWIIDDAQSAARDVRDELLSRIRDTVASDYSPNAWSRGHTNFQLTRGLLGVSL
jgi:hypothetical protein